MARAYNYDDAVFNAGMLHRVEVRMDRNARPSDRTDLSPYGGSPEEYEAVPGYESFACRLIPKGASDDDTDRGAAVRNYKVMYADPLRLDRTHLLLWVDPATGDLHRLFVTAASVDAHEMRHHCSVRCVEYVL